MTTKYRIIILYINIIYYISHLCSRKIVATYKNIFGSDQDQVFSKFYIKGIIVNLIFYAFWYLL